jgi:D-inositol-3-phosphate glycosyltransferase
MKILELSMSGTVGSDNMGPVSDIICALSNEFAKQKQDVTLADSANAIMRNQLRVDIRVLSIKSPTLTTFVSASDGPIKTVFKRLWCSYSFLRGVASKIQFSDFDIVHAHNPMIAFLLHWRYRVPYIYTAHSPHWCIEIVEGDQPIKRRQYVKRLFARMEKSAISHSRMTIAFGNYLKCCVPTANIEIIPSGVYPDHWIEVDRQVARNCIDLSAEDFVLVFIGRINPVKGLDVLIDAIRLVNPRISCLKVMIVGSFSGSFSERGYVTPYARNMMDRAKDLPVSFIGFLDNSSEQFRNYISSANAIVVPSREEPQGLVVLESLAMGRPVIASCTGGIPEMIEGSIGFLFPPGDVEALADCIEKLSHLPKDKVIEMQRSCRAHVEKHFSWPLVARRYIDAFKRNIIDSAK